MASKPSNLSVSASSTSESKAAKASGVQEVPANKIEQHSLNQTSLSSEERHARIAVAAYRLAEGRGFAPGGELEDWLRAERETDGAI
jgi:Protein of unknown function (DUF2934)